MILMSRNCREAGSQNARMRTHASGPQVSCSSWSLMILIGFCTYTWGQLPLMRWPASKKFTVKTGCTYGDDLSHAALRKLTKLSLLGTAESSAAGISKTAAMSDFTSNCPMPRPQFRLLLKHCWLEERLCSSATLGMARVMVWHRSLTMVKPKVSNFSSSPFTDIGTAGMLCGLDVSRVGTTRLLGVKLN